MKRMIWTLGLLVLCTASHATVYEVDGIFYTLQEDGTAKLVAPGDDGEGGSSMPIGVNTGYRGDVVVPETVDIGGESRPVTAIGDYAFLGATSLTSVTLPTTVTFIGSTPFANSTRLTDITVADDNPAFCSDDGVLFNKSRTILIACPAAKVGDYAVPVTVDSIANSAFYGCAKLTSLTLPSTVSRIGFFAFRGCSKLTTMTIPEGVETIRNGTFHSCRLMETVSIPSTVATIEDAAFFYCQSLKAITFPAALRTIGSNAFDECVSLSDVLLNEGLQAIGSKAFSRTKLTHVIIPSTVSAIGEAPFSSCMSLEAIEVDAGNTDYRAIDGVLFDTAVSRLICCPAGKTGDYVMPATVIVVEGSGFFSCRQLTSVQMSPALDSLGFSAFNGCWGITELKLPHTVKYIGENAFNNCTELASLTCHAMAPPAVDVNSFLTSTYNSPLYVPQRRVSTYKKAAVWKKFKTILPIPEGMEVTASDAFPGALATIDIAMNSAETGIVSYEFDLLLPEGVSPAFDTDGNVICTFTMRHQGTPLLTMIPLDDNAWHVKVTMEEGSILTGYDGEVMRLYINVDPDVGPDTYTAILDYPVMVLSDAYRVEMEYVRFDLTVNTGSMGDVNQDGYVNVSDVTVLVSNLLGAYSGTMAWQLGDINHDGKITVTDVTGLVNIILNIYP
ncbi:MAG: leucine-rich repeat protein [Prevotella sp.]|nr:leucine-rich repeat protein [Prevotella sp.]